MKAHQRPVGSLLYSVQMKVKLAKQSLRGDHYELALARAEDALADLEAACILLKAETDEALNR